MANAKSATCRTNAKYVRAKLRRVPSCSRSQSSHPTTLTPALRREMRDLRTMRFRRGSPTFGARPPPLLATRSLFWASSCVPVLVLVVASINAANAVPAQPEGGSRQAPLPELTEETSARLFLDSLETFLAAECNQVVTANWNLATNITAENQRISVDVNRKSAAFHKRLFQVLRLLFSEKGLYPKWERYDDRTLTRRIRLMTRSLGTSILDQRDLTEFLKIENEMKAIYSTATICLPGNTACEFSLAPDLSHIMATSRDEKLLRHVWTAWRDATGKQMRNRYQKNVEFLNKAATMNGFKDASAMWTNDFETPDFEGLLNGLWKQVSPLYEKLHAYARFHLRKEYGRRVIRNRAPIPAHLLGDMWAQLWNNIEDLLLPCKNQPFVNLTGAMVSQDYDALEMFRAADSFFTSMGLEPAMGTFWKQSILTKPFNRKIVCHASAWDFCLGPGGEDFRIKMCTRVSIGDFNTVHHEFGHIQYYMLYKHLPKVFRRGANPALHEAAGDTISLSVSTPSYLGKIGLRTPSKLTPEQQECEDLNHLMSVALKKIAPLPWTYVVDKWRWAVFKGEVEVKRMNEHWWKLREEIQGVRAPVARDENDFDPGAKFHVAANVPYERYFGAIFLQFQFYKALCQAAKQYDPQDPNKPLHRCDFYKNRDAGAAFRRGLSLGSSQPWPIVVEAITGQRDMTPDALLDYFKPLESFLDKFLKDNNECVGWGDRCQ